ncbi:hypothetical protein QTI96_01615 [Clostridium perfringens]|nr:hypothetical protein [Clostridium perfringens]
MIKTGFIRSEEAYKYLADNSDDVIDKYHFNKVLTDNFGKEFSKDKIIKVDEKFFVSKKWLDECIELFKISIDIDGAIRLILNNTGLQHRKEYKLFRCSILNRVKKLYNLYIIPFLGRDKTYISMKDVDCIIKEIKDVQMHQCVNSEELPNVIGSNFPGIIFSKTSREIFVFLRENNLKVIKPNNIANVFINNCLGYDSKSDLYPKETIDKITENVQRYCKGGKVKLINLSYDEYFSMEQSKFEKTYMLLTKDEFMKIEGYKNCEFRNYKRTFKNTDVKCIWIRQEGTYVSKKEFSEFLDFKENYVSLKKYFNDNGNDLLMLNIARFLEVNSFDFKKYKESCYIHKDDIDRFIKLRRYKLDLSKSDTLYDRFLVKFNYYNSDKKGKFKKLDSIYLKYVEDKSKTNNTIAIIPRMFSVYKALLESIEMDLEPKNKEANDRLFKKALLLVGESIDGRTTLIGFNRYLINKYKYNISEITDLRQKGTKGQYSKEVFIELLIKLVDIIADKNNIRKLYRNWSLSTSITYLFMHFTLAWRRRDLVEQLPVPDLRIIPEVSDGESFIKWLEDGNEISDKMAIEICNSIEVITKRINLTANKNDQRLSCIISSELSKEVATLLCISEANKQIHISKSHKKIVHKNLFNKRFTIPKVINKTIKDNFDIDINEILQEPFDNVKMNKSFLQLVKDKAEELGLAYSYYYAQVTRGHKGNPDVLSNTTKIYLSKDISKASLMAFATGTMGSVMHVILQLVDKTYESKDYLEKIETIKKLEITPYTIENNIMKISNKVSTIKNEIDTYLKGGGTLDDLLKKLFYSKNAYGIIKRTRCLLKITRENNLGIIRIKSVNYSDSENNIIDCPLRKKSCIGCDYMIALRYFIYEFSKRFEQIVVKAEKCESELDKELCVSALNEIYIPVLNDLAEVIGKDVQNIIDIERYARLAKSI